MNLTLTQVKHISPTSLSGLEEGTGTLPRNYSSYSMTHDERPPPSPSELTELSNSVFQLCRRSIGQIPCARQALPMVHKGFWSAYSSIRGQLQSSISDALDKEYAPLFITGHSLGGALGILAAYDITNNFDLPEPVTVYNFGTPRVGNVAFSALYNSKVPGTFRVVVDGDVISGMPKFFGIYKHVGIHVLVDENNGGNLIVKPSAVETSLRLRKRTSATNHSLTVYSDCLEACFSPDDLMEYLPKVRGGILGVLVL